LAITAIFIINLKGNGLVDSVLSPSNATLQRKIAIQI